MFVYCGNNPVSRSDDGGYFWDIVFDVVSLVVSVIEVVNNPDDVGAWIGLAGDVIDVVVPCVGGVGETVRAANTARKVVDAADDVHDAGNVIDVVEIAGDTARKTNFYITPSGEAIPGTLDGFNNNLSKLECKNGKYFGVDSSGPVRIRANEIHPNNPNFTGTVSEYHEIPHFHIDRRKNGDTGDWKSIYVGAMEMLDK